MSHVERVQVSDFKCLSEVDLECGQFNVLTGRNGTGKTSILEAIRLAHDPTALESYEAAVGNLIAVGEESLGVELTTLDGSLDFSIERVDSDETYGLVSRTTVRNCVVLSENEESIGYKRQLNEQSGVVESFEEHLRQVGVDLSDSVVRVCSDGFTGTFVSPSSRVRELVVDPDGWDNSLTSEERVATMGIPPGQGFVEDPPDTTEVRFVDRAGSWGKVSDADSELRRVRVRDFLREHDILPNLESFGFDELVFDEDGSHHAIPYEFLGEGTKTVVEVVWQLLAEEEIPDVILLEEPENHLHPGYVKELVVFLIEFAREEDVQLFVTTHNVDFLTEFFNDATVGDHTDWLREEFRLIQTTELSPKQFDYERAREHVEDLQLDLRGL